MDFLHRSGTGRNAYEKRKHSCEDPTDFAEVFSKLKKHINPAWFGAAVVICISFLPFFAMKEVSRVMGTEKFRGLFFKKQG